MFDGRKYSTKGWTRDNTVEVFYFKGWEVNVKE